MFLALSVPLELSSLPLGKAHTVEVSMGWKKCMHQKNSGRRRDSSKDFERFCMILWQSLFLRVSFWSNFQVFRFPYIFCWFHSSGPRNGVGSCCGHCREWWLWNKAMKSWCWERNTFGTCWIWMNLMYIIYLGDGFKILNIFLFIPIWGNDPIWRIKKYVSNGLVQPPTRNFLGKFELFRFTWFHVVARYKYRGTHGEAIRRRLCQEERSWEANGPDDGFLGPPLLP